MSNVLKLSVEERVKLIGLIWDSISEFPEAISLNEQQSQELDKRLDNYENNRRGNVSWEEAKKMILNK